MSLVRKQDIVNWLGSIEFNLAIAFKKSFFFSSSLLHSSNTEAGIVPSIFNRRSHSSLYFPSSSKPIAFLPRIFAATRDVPLPAKGSRIVSPGLLAGIIIIRSGMSIKLMSLQEISILILMI